LHVFFIGAHSIGKINFVAQKYTMRSTIQYIENELAEVYPFPEIRGFIRIILEKVCGLSYTEQVLHKDRELPEADKKLIEATVSRLKKNEPIQYIFGETEFRDLRLKVNPSVLIPRPETEELIDFILGMEVGADAKIIDIGTGSGCIALALKSVLPEAKVYGLDVSEKALGVATENAELNSLDVAFLQRDILKWEADVWEQYDVIVSNPPYVRNSEKPMMEKNVLEYEPTTALFVTDDDPLLFYRRISEFAQKFLHKNGWLFFEINEYLGNEMVDLLKHLSFSEIQMHKDINGRNRMLACRK